MTDSDDVTARSTGASPAAASRSREVADLDPWLTRTLKEAKYILANNAVEGDVWAGRIRDDIDAILTADERSRLQPAAAAEAPGAERVIDILEDAGVPEEWRTHYANLIAEALTAPPPVSVDEMVGRLRLWADADVRETGRDGTFEQADAEKWASMMEDAASLLTSIGQENSRLRRGLADGNDLLASISAALAEQEEENERLREALEAIDGGWIDPETMKPSEPSVSDLKTIAREALRSRTVLRGEGDE